MASPFDPAVSPTTAIPASKEVHVAQVVKFCTVLSARVPMAVNCSDVPGAMLDGGDGFIAIDATGEVVSVVDPDMDPEVAVMVVEPIAVVVVARPCEPEALLIVAIPGVDDPQLTSDVKFSLTLFE